MPPKAPKRTARTSTSIRGNCAFVRFWSHWGGHFDLAGGVACLVMLSTILWAGFDFIRDTQALTPEVHTQHQQIELVTARTDRMGGNIELIMRALHIKPLSKSDSERQLEEEQGQ